MITESSIDLTDSSMKVLLEKLANYYLDSDKINSKVEERYVESHSEVNQNIEMEKSITGKKCRIFRIPANDSLRYIVKYEGVHPGIPYIPEF